jgi:thiol:disulfide interchange protein
VPIALACDPGVPSRNRSSARQSVPAPTVAARTDPPSANGESWNATQIRWEPLQPGLEHAKREHKPVMLVVYTDWCPHCKNFSQVFGDPRVVALADRYVMIRVNQDQDDALSSRYSPDGTYIPRTLFLTPEGQLRADMTGNNPRYRHFLDERGAESLVQLMKRGVGS